MAKPAAAKRAKNKGAARRAEKAPPKKKKDILPPKLETAPEVIAKKVRAAKGRDPGIALATIQAAQPDITAAAYAVAHKIPSDDQFRMQRFAALYVQTGMKKQAAAKLMGYNEFEAITAGELFFNHVYTQLFIHELLILARVEDVISTGPVLAAIWKEANAPDKVLGKAVVTNSTTRLKALALCVQVLRLGTPPPKDPNGGNDDLPAVMLIPGDLPADQWAKHAAAEQAALKREVTQDAGTFDRIPKITA